MASINKKIQVALGNSPAIKRLAYQKAYGMFAHAKRMMLNEFDRHPVTQEILSGPKGVNMSGTLDGYGNLFAFIGFDAEEKPTEELRDLLEMGTTFRQTVYRNGAWYFRFNLPTRDAITNATQMPWEKGNSWAFGVETFISGLSHFLYKRWYGKDSRSGMGIQLPYENLEDAQFTNVPYITEILQHFRERVNRE
jgi:hypothetical protein